MLKNFKWYLSGAVTTAILMTGAVAYAETAQKIDAVFGRIKLVVDNKAVNEETLLYNGTTYVPLRAAAEILGKEVAWDGDTNTAYIDELGTARNFGSSQEQTESKPTAVSEKGTLDNPYRLNETATISTYSEKYEITFTEVISGQDANDIAFDANFNNVLEKGKEYYLVKAKVKAIELKDKNDPMMFGLSYGFYTESGSKYPFKSAASINPSTITLLEGASDEVWLTQVINENDNTLLALTDQKKGNVWFDLGRSIQVDKNNEKEEKDSQRNTLNDADKPDVKYYSDNKNVPDFGRYAGIQPQKIDKKSIENTILYRYDMMEIESGNQTGYYELLEDAGFVLDLEESGSSILTYRKDRTIVVVFVSSTTLDISVRDMK